MLVCIVMNHDLGVIDDESFSSACLRVKDRVEDDSNHGNNEDSNDYHVLLFIL